MKVGVIGVGTVGKPLYEALKYYHGDEVYGYDVKNKINTFEEILTRDLVFICVPTDSGDDGRLDMSIIDSVLEKLAEADYNGIVVIKSTMRLGYINKTIIKYAFSILVFPEWLTALNAFPDTLKPEMTVIGAEDANVCLVDKVLEACPWHKNTDGCVFQPEEAVMIKLTANALASTKISFANQIKHICNKHDINVHAVMGKIKTDPRCAPRYLNPGGSYSGYCLPKDTLELECSCDETYLLKGVRKVNERNEDW